MKPKLPASVSSRQDLKAVIMELQGFLHWLSQNDIKQAVTKQSFGEQPALSPAAQELITGWPEANPLNRETLAKLVENLEGFAAKAPFVSVTLAAPAPASLRQAIVSWFRQNTRSDLLVDFNFNATMLGGIVVRYGSHVYDGSFRRMILANRAKFPEVLRNV